RERQLSGGENSGRHAGEKQTLVRTNEFPGSGIRSPERSDLGAESASELKGGVPEGALLCSEGEDDEILDEGQNHTYQRNDEHRPADHAPEWLPALTVRLCVDVIAKVPVEGRLVLTRKPRRQLLHL